ncbi:MAG TPA: efflux RND transporter periplasmic adaptor subunit [Terriglobales bacterium]|nr:efflux RND transporter periplasmic adaptor subunit [Terriglobales bacterium]
MKKLIMAAVLVLALVGIQHYSQKNARPAGNVKPSLRPVAVALVKRAPVRDLLRLPGAFRAYQQVDVHAKVAGYIRDIYVDVGDHVKEGQLLATLEVPELNAEVVAAKANVQRYQESVRRSQSEIKRAESSYAAYHAAYVRLRQAADARPKLIALQELDDALAKDQETQAQIESAHAGLAESQSQLAAAQAELGRLSALEAYSRITAPFTGVVTKRYADTGALIQAGTASETQSMPVVQVAEWSRLRLVVPVPESAVSLLHVGSIVQVHVSALKRDFEGRVTRFADAVDEETRTMHTEIDVENPDDSLKEGMYAEAIVVLREQKDALCIPIQALERHIEGATVLIVDSHDRVQERQVTLGVEGSDRVQVLDGLAEGDRVIVGGRSQVTPGEKVVPKVLTESGDEDEESF